MPVRSLDSSVLKWPNWGEVRLALEVWTARALSIGDVLSVGFFGSYARGDWGVGSDLDLVVVVKDSDLPFERRSAHWDTTSLPVPVDLLVYTQEEWQSFQTRGPVNGKLMREIIWLHPRDTAR